ncbi:MAG: 50S ribosomal protein L15 [bacterium]
MDLASLTKTPGSRRPRKRVGRGMASGHGKTCCRGHKGQMARKGHKIKIAFEGGQMPLLRRLPKRGFKNPTRVACSHVNMHDLSMFPDGSEVTPELLRSTGLVPKNPERIKVLADGECKVKLTVKAHAFSAAAQTKIEAAGGSCVTIE